MSKFNRGVAAPETAAGPLRSSATADRLTHEGGIGYSRDARTEVYLLATGGFVAEDSYYESGDERVQRFTQLVRGLAVSDPGWLWQFLVWLRAHGNIRTAPVVGAVEAVHARIAHERLVAQAAPHADGGLPVNPPGVVGGSGDQPRGWSRTLIDQVCQRADEPGELVAYHQAKHGRNLPKPIKRGLADAIGRLYTEYSSFKYDSENCSVRFGDVVDICHPNPGNGDRLVTRGHQATLAPDIARSDLYRWLLDRRHGRAPVSPETAPRTLPVVRARLALQRLPVNERRAVLTHARMGGWSAIGAAGMTWESVSGWLQGPMDGPIWEALIPNMGLMALTRNLRNFDDANIGTEAFSQVAGRLADASEVRRSHMLPYRFYQACRNANYRWLPALEAALIHSTQNIPVLPGRTLVLIDTSGSMESTLSARSAMTFAEAAALFGVALAVKANNADPQLVDSDTEDAPEVDLYGFAGGGFGGRHGNRRTFRHHVPQGTGVLESVAAFTRRIGEVGHGTEIIGSIRDTFQPYHSRVIVISDMQTRFERENATLDAVVPASVPVYGFNLSGYDAGLLASSGVPGSNRHDLGGLTDHTFGMIRSLEQGVSGHWPWEAAG